MDKVSTRCPHGVHTGIIKASEVLIFQVDAGVDKVSTRLSIDISGHFPPSLEGECPVSTGKEKASAGGSKESSPKPTQSRESVWITDRLSGIPRLLPVCLQSFGVITHEKGST
jgi:hypothetical protein